MIRLGTPGCKASGFLLHHGGSFDVGISRLISDSMLDCQMV